LSFLTFLLQPKVHGKGFLLGLLLSSFYAVKMWFCTGWILPD